MNKYCPNLRERDRQTDRDRDRDRDRETETERDRDWNRESTTADRKVLNNILR